MKLNEKFELIKKYFLELWRSIKTNWISIIILNLIILFLDYFNIPSSILNKDILYDDCIFISLLLTVFCTLYLLHNRNYKCFKDKDKNIIDDLIIFVVLFFAVNSISNILMDHKLMLNIVFIVIGLIMIIVRTIYIFLYKKSKFESNTISCYDLYKNNLNNIKSGTPILISDEPLTNIENDLLDFKTIKDSLINYCRNCHTKNHFVLGLTGNWGSGKTSLLNLIAKETKDEKIVFKIFKPWEYSSTEAMFTGLYNLIAEELGKNGNKLDLHTSLRKYKKVLFEYAKNIINIDFGALLENNDFSVDSINKEINNILEDMDNELIIIIDDIDRLNQKDAVFLLKVIKNIVSFNKVKYIISYDESRLRKILNFNNEYEEEYLDKIVNAKLNVPSLDRESFKSLFITMMHNLLVFYNAMSNKNELDIILEKISSDLTNMRDCIRFINSLSLSINTLLKYELYLPDFIGIEYIKYKNKPLYDSIYNNYHKYSKLIKNNPNELAKEFNASTNQINILETFPEDIYIKKDRRLLTAEYIYVYYGNKANKSINISEEIKELVNQFNLNRNINTKLKKILLDNDNLIYQDVLINNLDGIKELKKFLMILLNYNTSFIKIVQKIIPKIELEPGELEEILNKNIVLAHAIATSILKYGNSSEEINLRERCVEFLQNRIAKIIDNRIDLYLNKNYIYGQLNVLKRYIPGREISEYINEIATPRNIIRIIADNITISTNGISHYMNLNSNNLNYYIGDNKIKYLLQKRSKVLNEDEKLIINVYKNKKVEVSKNIDLEKLDI